MEKMIILDCNMSDHFDYETPGQLLEWGWIEDAASYVYRGNGQLGVWDFMVNVSLFADEHGPSHLIPERLQPFFKEAVEAGASFILFNQGT